MLNRCGLSIKLIFILFLSFLSMPLWSLSASKHKEFVRQIEGIVEHRIADGTNQEYEEYLLRTNTQEYYLRFTAPPPRNLRTGAFLILKNVVIGRGKISEIFVSPMSIAAIKPVPIPYSLGPQKTIVFLFNFQNQPSNRPWTVAQTNTTFDSVNAMYHESSYNQTTVNGPILDWYTLPIDSTASCDSIKSTIIANGPLAAQSAGIDISGFKHRVYLFPKTSSCSWAGLGTVGTPTNSYSNAYLNGANTVRTMGHELGHNLGLRHSKYLKCSSGPNTGNCSVDTYGDNTDIMGGAKTGHFNAYQKEKIGWLNANISPPIITVTRSGTYLIDAYETLNTNPKALKVLKRSLADGSSDYYYLEFRQGIGFDAPLTCNNCDFTKGVVFHQGNSKNADTIQALDMTPFDNNPNTIALLPGFSFSDVNAPAGGVTFTVNTITPEGAWVTIQFGNV